MLIVHSTKRIRKMKSLWWSTRLETNKHDENAWHYQGHYNLFQWLHLSHLTSDTWLWSYRLYKEWKSRLLLLISSETTWNQRTSWLVWLLKLTCYSNEQGHWLDFLRYLQWISNQIQELQCLLGCELLQLPFRSIHLLTDFNLKCRNQSYAAIPILILTYFLTFSAFILILQILLKPVQFSWLFLLSSLMLYMTPHKF